MSDTNLGRVVVELQAKTAQFNMAMNGAANTTDATIAKMRGRFDRIGESIEELGTATATTTDDTIVFTKQQQKLADQAFKTGQGLDLVRSSITRMSMSAAGIKGPLGTLLAGILRFTSGNLVTMGVMAGIAGIVMGFKLIGAGAREAAAGVVTLRQEWTDLMARGRPLVGAFLSLQDARDRLAEIKAEITKELRGTPVFTISGGVIPMIGGTRIDQKKLTELNNQRSVMESIVALWGEEHDKIKKTVIEAHALTAEEQALLDLKRRAREAFAVFAAPELTTDIQQIYRPLREFAEAIAELTPAQERLRQEVIRFGPAIREQMEEGLIRAEVAMVSFTDSVAMVVSTLGGTSSVVAYLQSLNLTVDQMVAVFSAAELPIDKIRRILEALGLTAEEVQAAMKRIKEAVEGITDDGDDAAISFAAWADAMNKAVQSLSALKSVLQDLKSGNILGILGGLAGGALGLLTAPTGFGFLGALGGYSAGRNLFGEPSGQASPINLNVNVGRPTNPMAMARDREWQMALRESLLVAEAHGFRLARG